MRRTRNYKEKSTVFTFGHFALPIAAVIAIGLLFVGVKTFFFSSTKPAGIPVTSEMLASDTYDISAPLTQEPNFTFAGEMLPGTELPEAAATTAQEPATPEAIGPIVLAGPLPAQGTPAASGTNTARNTGTSQTAAPASTASPTATAAPANSRWGVQIGAFVNASSATALASEVQRQGYTTSVSRVDSSGRTFHRVRVSAGNTREEANRLAAELQRKGYPVSVVPMS